MVRRAMETTRLEPVISLDEVTGANNRSGHEAPTENEIRALSTQDLAKLACGIVTGEVAHHSNSLIPDSERQLELLEHTLDAAEAKIDQGENVSQNEALASIALYQIASMERNLSSGNGDIQIPRSTVEDLYPSKESQKTFHGLVK